MELPSRELAQRSEPASLHFPPAPLLPQTTSERDSGTLEDGLSKLPQELGADAVPGSRDPNLSSGGVHCAGKLKLLNG